MANLLYGTILLCFILILSVPSLTQSNHLHSNNLKLGLEDQGTGNKKSEGELKDDSANSSKEEYVAARLPCPIFCKCTQNPLVIQECTKDPANNLDVLLREHLNSTRITITRSFLTNLPLLVCKMKMLTSIDVSHNLIENLPWDCLKQLKLLNSITATGNRIKKLENGSFYDFPSLQSLNLASNQISEIDVDVFRQVKRLQEIRNIDLYNNHIVSLDPWPLLFVERKTTINLGTNKISRFTNRFNWNFTCTEPKPTAEINFRSNNITHFVHLFGGWRITQEIDILCLFSKIGKMELNYNPYNCDCTDYPVLRLIHFIKQSPNFQLAFCSKPQNLYHKPVLSVDLNDILCKVMKQCPKECTCVEQPNKMKIYVNCSGPEVGHLPKQLPKLPKKNYKYQLNFANTNITSLDYRPYLSNTSIALLSYNKIRNMSLKALNALSQADYVHLDNNYLQYLPENISSVDMSSVNAVYLKNNKWICDCHAKETRSWMLQAKKIIGDSEAILCESPYRVKGINLLLLKDKDLICGNLPNKELTAYLGAGASALSILILAIAVTLLLKYKRVWLHKRFQWHPFDMDECEGEDKEFDVFVSYANENEEYVENDLIKNLENRGYKIAFHRVNFPGGQPIHVSIEQCIRKSKRTLVVLSNDFVNSAWCMWEFAAALEFDGNEGTHRLLTIKYEDVDIESLDLTLQTYFNRYSYVLHNAPTFWDNLVYSLPQRKMGKPDNQEYDADNRDDDLCLDDQLYIGDVDFAPLLQNY